MPVIETKPFAWSFSELVKAHDTGTRNLTKKESRTLIAVVIIGALVILSPIFFAALFLPSERASVINGLLKVFKLGIILFLGYFVFFFVFVRFRLWVDFQASHKLYQQNRTVACSDQGVDIVSSTTNTHVDWSHFQSVSESNAFFLLFYGKRLFVAIPKKVLELSQVDELRIALQNKIKKFKKLS